jgi:hypothetical protein
MAIKLDETQLALLGAAARRDDHFLAFPKGRGMTAARRAASQLLAAGLARELRAHGEAPVWRHAEDSQCAFALKLTAAGAKAIAAVADDGKDGSQRRPDDEVEAAPRKDKRPAQPSEKAISTDAPPASVAAPRSGTKIDNVVKMLSRPEARPLRRSSRRRAGCLIRPTPLSLACANAATPSSACAMRKLVPLFTG